MNVRFFIWSSTLIVSLVVVGLCIRLLALQGVPVSESLILRGFSCFIFVIIYAIKYHLSLIPKSLKSQLLRATLAGLALTFLSLSYNWLTASTVSVLSNIDVPLLLVLGPLIGIQASRLARVLSLISILFLLWYLANLERQVNLLYGLGALTLGSLLLCFGYLFIKKSMMEENKAVAIMTPSLAIVFYGLFEMMGGSGSISSAWNQSNLIFCILSGAGMFIAYIATMKLYEITDLATAEFPTLISSIVIQPAELIFLNEPIHRIYLISSIGFVLMTYFIMTLEKSKIVSETYAD